MIIADKNYHLSIADRSFNYGDGCFTTILVSNFEAQLLNEHIQRLQLACQTLSIENLDWVSLQTHVIQQARQQQIHVLKVHISRGLGGRGYDASNVNEPVVSVSSHAFPEQYLTWRQTGIDVAVARLRLSTQPALARIKHNNRLEQVLLKNELSSVNNEVDDLLVCDSNNNLVEATSANCFWFTNNSWFTPSVDLCGVEGVMRNHVLSFLACNNQKISIVKQDISSLEKASSVFLCNSVMGIVPVNSCVVAGDVWRYSNDETEQLMRGLGY